MIHQATPARILLSKTIRIVSRVVFVTVLCVAAYQLGTGATTKSEVTSKPEKLTSGKVNSVTALNETNSQVATETAVPKDAITSPRPDLLKECGGPSTDYIEALSRRAATDFLTPSTIAWENKPIPKDLKSTALKAYASFLNVPTTRLQTDDTQFTYAYVSLLGGSEPEVIVDYEEFSGTGGRSWTIYRKINQHWHNIGGFLGGFFAYKRDQKFDQIIVYERSGDDYYHMVLKFDVRAGVYKETDSFHIPDEIKDSIHMYCFFQSIKGTTW
jgi:hypothetical protein